MAENAEPAYPTQKDHQPVADQLADASIRHSNQQKAARNESNHQPRAIPLTTKKRLLPKEEPQPAYIRKNRSNAKPPYQQSRAEAKRLPNGTEPNRGPVVREPRGGQIYKVDREFRTSRRALNVLSVRVRTVRAGDLICLPPGGGAPRPNPSASSSASSAVPGSVHHGGQARCRRWGSPA